MKKKNRFKVESFDIYVGTNYLNKGGKYYKLEKIISHKEHNKPRLANDIAVAKVKGTFEFNEKVKPIELLKDEVPEGGILQITGWGSLTVSVTFSFSV